MMWRALGFLLLFITSVSTTTSAQTLGTESALPVGPGRPGHGPWQIKVWPAHGCTTCVVPPEDQRTFEEVRDALLSADPSAIVPFNTKVVVLTFVGGQAEHTADLIALRQSFAGCRIGSQGPLRPNNNADPATSFGLGVDCPGRARRQFASLTISGGAVKTAYYLPDELISVVVRPQAH